MKYKNLAKFIRYYVHLSSYPDSTYTVSEIAKAEETKYIFDGEVYKFLAEQIEAGNELIIDAMEKIIKDNDYTEEFKQYEIEQNKI